MRSVYKCKCGGALVAHHFVEIKEGETFEGFYTRIKNVEENKIIVHQCNKCLKNKLYK
jgi:hypothetical protein